MRKQIQVTTGNARLHIRSGPNISYKIVGYMKNGDKAIVDKLTTTKNGQKWYRIEGTNTWIAQNDYKKTSSTSYFKITKDYEANTKKKAEKVKDLPVKKEKKQNNYKENKNMNKETIVKYGDEDNTTLDRRMKSNNGSGKGGVYISDNDDNISDMMIKIRKNMSIGNPDRSNNTDSVITQMFTQFNRWNMAFPDYHLMKTHTKIFFTRPDLNIMKSSSELQTQASSDPFYLFLYKNQPYLLKYLTKYATNKHQFNPMISNNPKSFEVSDEYIKTLEAGETYTGYKIFYGRNDIESKAAGEISINYIDDYNVDIYKMNKAWVDYISKVSRGEFSPKSKYKQTKVLDYAVALYYFLLGPDGETILFWSKFTGVFPTNTSSSTFSWDKDTMTKMPELNIKYVYSFKRDLDPTHLAEFNALSSNYANAQYLKTYEDKNLGMGQTWAGAPFVISGKNAKGNLVYKLKFRPT
jgi:hypothetical protein